MKRNHHKSERRFNRSRGGAGRRAPACSTVSESAPDNGGPSFQPPIAVSMVDARGVTLATTELNSDDYLRLVDGACFMEQPHGEALSSALKRGILQNENPLCRLEKAVNGAIWLLLSMERDLRSPEHRNEPEDLRQMMDCGKLDVMDRVIEDLRAADRDVRKQLDAMVESEGRLLDKLSAKGKAS